MSKTFNINTGIFVRDYIDTGQPNYIVEYTGIVPDWFNNEGTQYGQAFYFNFIAPAVATTVINFRIMDIMTFPFTEISTGTITINAGQGFELREICCDNIRNIAWLNSAGGWRSYVFTGKKQYKVDIGENTTFKTDGVIRFSERKNVYDAELVTTGYIEKYDVEYCKSLRTAIQAFLYNEVTEQWDIPILIQPESFILFEDKQRFYQFSFEFIYAEELVIQSQ
jgi:hypothetical protein